MADLFNPQIEGVYYTFNTYTPPFIGIPALLMGSNPNRVSLILTNSNGHFVNIYINPSPNAAYPTFQLEPSETKIIRWDDAGPLICQTIYYSYTTYTTNNNNVTNGNLIAIEIIYKPTG